MGYYYEYEETLDVSGLFPTLKGCIAAAEGVAEMKNTPVKVYAQTAGPVDLLIGTVTEFVGDFTIWVFDETPEYKAGKR